MARPRYVVDTSVLARLTKPVVDRLGAFAAVTGQPHEWIVERGTAD